MTSLFESVECDLKFLVEFQKNLEFQRMNFQEVWLNQICTEQVSKDNHAMSEFDWRHFVTTFVMNNLL